MSKTLKVAEVIEIIVKKTKYSTDEVRELIKHTVDSMDNMVTEEGAAYVVADNLGISLELDQTAQYFSIDQLVPGQSNISIIARIRRIYPIRNFTRKDGTPGKVMNLELIDAQGTVRMAIWDSKCDLIETKGITIGDVVRINGANTKAGRDDTNELSLGLHGMIDSINDEDHDMPEVKNADLMIVSDLNSSISETSLNVKIIEKRDIFEFDRDGKKGRVMNLIVADNSGSIQLTAWNDMVDKINLMELGSTVLLKDLRVGENKNKELQVTFSESSTSENILNSDFDEIKANSNDAVLNLSELKAGMTVNVVCRITDLGEKRSFEKDNETRHVQTISIMDSSAVTRLTFWGDDIDTISQLSLDKIVKFENCKTRLNTYSNEVELNFNTSSKINFEFDGNKEDFDFSVTGISLENISEARSGVTIIGVVKRKFENREITLSDGREAVVLNLIIQDTNGFTAKLSAWDDVIPKFEDFEENDGIMLKNVKIKPGSGEYDPEINTFKSSLVSKLTLAEVGPIIQTADTFRETQYEKTDLNRLVNDSRVRVQGTIINVFKPAFYDGCMECNRKITIEDGSNNGSCQVHGESAIDPKMIITLTLDDTNATVLVKFFPGNSQKLISLAAEEAKEKIDRLSDHKAVTQPIIMKEIWAEGKVFFDAERDVQSIHITSFGDLDIDKETSAILNKFDGF